MENAHQPKTLLYALIPVAVLILALLGIYFLRQSIDAHSPAGPHISPNNGNETITKFANNEDFVAYMNEAESYASSNFNSIAVTQMAMPRAAMLESSGDSFGAADFGTSYLGEPAPKVDVDRVSDTNVQVIGIDEPDIVKTDGKEIYVSAPRYGVYYYDDVPAVRPLMIEPDVMFEETSPSTRIAPPTYPKGGVHAVHAFPPADLKIDSTIDTTGDLLLYESTLMVFSGQNITAYDVSTPESTDEVWDIDLDDQTYLVTSRLMDNKLYLVTATGYGRYQPCPIPLLNASGHTTQIACQDIYHPSRVIPADSTYTILTIDTESGDIEDTVSFVGSRNNTVVYMSTDSIFVTYQRSVELLPFFAGFLSDNADLFPTWLIDKVNQLNSYDIGNNAKMTEFSEVLAQYEASLNSDEQLRTENEIENRIEQYYTKHQRELEHTGIMKIEAQGLDIAASGSVPGRLLNQFSLDEYKGNLRVATTIDSQSLSFGGFGRVGESANDIYVLDKNLSITGSITDLGLDERIYSARFIEDRGYLVTFRQTDPFFVLDLSNPRDPKMTGQLKIPGFSSYLHPIDDELVLGVGREGSQVKVSLFDVSDVYNPVERSTYKLNEYWSEVQNTHHAFLIDKKYDVFFLPGGNGGYIFSYEDTNLSLKKAVSNIRAKRALFINNYMYVVGDDKIVVLNESDWERINELQY